MTGPWTGASGHPRELLQDLLDGRLDAAAARAVERHLVACASCRREKTDLEGARAAAATLRVEREMPHDLVAAVAAALDAEDVTAVPVPPAPWHRRPIAVGALAATVLLAAWVWWGRSGSGDVSVPAQAARDFVAVAENGSLALERRTDRAADLEAFFAEAPNAPRVRVIDLGMMGFTLEGGRRHVIGGVPSALYVYRGTDGQRLACQMFEGRLEDLPPTADLRENNGFMFRVYRDGDVSMVFWQEGDLVCVLVSRLPVEEVVALAFAKAMRPA